MEQLTTVDPDATMNTHDHDERKARPMKPFVYTNARGETVMDYRIFTELSDKAKNRITRAAYPKKNRTTKKTNKRRVATSS